MFLISSTLLLLAPSISMTSLQLPLVISTQSSHLPQGLGVGPCSQLRALARSLADEVLPTPLGPQKRYA